MKNRESMTASKPTFVGSWLREFLLANHDLVGTTFSVPRLCICIEAVFDLNQYQEGSVVYRVTDSDLSIRAVFTANSLLSANDSEDSEPFTPLVLSKATVILEAFRLSHLSIPGMVYGDFVLEVHSFMWDKNIKVQKDIEAILHLTPQFIWCSEDPQLQGILKTVFNKRSGGLLSVFAVTNHLDQILNELHNDKTTFGMLYIPPKIEEMFGLNNLGQSKSDSVSSGNNGETSLKKSISFSFTISGSTGNSQLTPKKPTTLDKTGTDFQMLSTNVEKSSVCQVNDSPKTPVIVLGDSNEMEPLTSRKEKKFSSNFEIITLSDDYNKDNSEKFVVQTLLVSDPECSHPKMQPQVVLERLSRSEITELELKMDLSVNEKVVNLLNSAKKKSKLPKWVPRTIKLKHSPVKSLNKSANHHTSGTSPSHLSAQTKTNCIDHRLETTQKGIYDPVLQHWLPESQINLPLSDSLLVSTSQGLNHDNFIENISDNPSNYMNNEEDYIECLSEPIEEAKVLEEYRGVPDMFKANSALYSTLNISKKCSTDPKTTPSHTPKISSIFQDAFSQWIEDSSKKCKTVGLPGKHTNTNHTGNTVLPSLKTSRTSGNPSASNTRKLSTTSKESCTKVAVVDKTTSTRSEESSLIGPSINQEITVLAHFKGPDRVNIHTTKPLLLECVQDICNPDSELSIANILNSPGPKVVLSKLPRDMYFKSSKQAKLLYESLDARTTNFKKRTNKLQSQTVAVNQMKKNIPCTQHSTLSSNTNETLTEVSKSHKPFTKTTLDVSTKCITSENILHTPENILHTPETGVRNVSLPSQGLGIMDKMLPENCTSLPSGQSTQPCATRNTSFLGKSNTPIPKEWNLLELEYTSASQSPNKAHVSSGLLNRTEDKSLNFSSSALQKHLLTGNVRERSRVSSVFKSKSNVEDLKICVNSDSKSSAEDHKIKSDNADIQKQTSSEMKASPIPPADQRHDIKIHKEGYLSEEHIVNSKASRKRKSFTKENVSASKKLKKMGELKGMCSDSVSFLEENQQCSKEFLVTVAEKRNNNSEFIAKTEEETTVKNSEVSMPQSSKRRQIPKCNCYKTGPWTYSNDLLFRLWETVSSLCHDAT